MGEKQGIGHPCRCGKQCAGQNVVPAGAGCRRKGIDRGGQGNERQRQGQEADFIPEGDEFHCNRKELRHERKQTFPDDQENKHGGDENEDDHVEDKDLQQALFAGEFIIFIDIRNFFSQIFYGAEGKPQSEGQPEGQDGAVGIGRHVDEGDIQEGDDIGGEKGRNVPFQRDHGQVESTQNGDDRQHEGEDGEDEVVGQAGRAAADFLAKEAAEGQIQYLFCFFHGKFLSFV